MTRKLLPVIVALGLASTLSLSGCSLLPHIPSLPHNSGGSSSSGGGSSSGGSPSDDQPHATLPSNFPKDVPLAGTDYAYALQVSDKAWGVYLRVDNADTGFATAAQKLNDAGITQDTSIGGSSGGATIGAFHGNGYTVQVTAVSESEWGPVVQYAIVKTD